MSRVRALVRVERQVTRHPDADRLLGGISLVTVAPSSELGRVFEEADDNNF